MRLVHITQADATTDSYTLTSHIHSEGDGGSVVTKKVYAYTVRDKCLSGPPPNWGQWRRSVLLDFIGNKVGMWRETRLFDYSISPPSHLGTHTTLTAWWELLP